MRKGCGCSQKFNAQGIGCLCLVFGQSSIAKELWQRWDFVGFGLVLQHMRDFRDVFDVGLLRCKATASAGLCWHLASAVTVSVSVLLYSDCELYRVP